MGRTVFVFRNRIKGGVAAFHRNIKGVISPTTQIPDHFWKKSFEGKLKKNVISLNFFAVIVKHTLD